MSFRHLIMVMLSAWAGTLLAQDRIPLDSIPPQDPIHSDTLARTDTAQALPGYQELWESDTVGVGPDSMRYYNQAPRVMGDTFQVAAPLVEKDASRALMYALVLPGLGQAYNQKYWKMPLVWLGIGASIYAINYNRDNYLEASRNYIEEPSSINERYLTFWRRNMELSYIAAMAIYGLQMLDAYVDALLFSWDVNEDLSMRLAPSLQPLSIPGSMTGHSIGLTASFKLK